MRGAFATLRAWPIERPLRLATGLTLFAYAASHFLSHASGLFLLDAMDRVGRGIILAPWRTEPGRLVLLAAVLIHAGLGLKAFIRRRHLIIRPLEAVQLGLGLSIPLLLIPHVTNVRLGWTLYGLDDSYFRILYQYWISSPLLGLSRQFLLMLAVWVHGCIGLHMWLRFRPWYRRWSAVLLGAAIALPVLAVLGIMNAGWDTSVHAMVDSGFAAAHGPPPPGTPAAADRAQLANLWTDLQYAYLALLVLAILARVLRHRLARRYAGIKVTYPGRRAVTVPLGYSILEASRLAGIRHAAMCGGRARCSTCRVRVLHGLEALPEANAAERMTLARIRAPDHVRLACQTRPTGPVSVVPLVTPGQEAGGLRIAFEQGREHEVTALAVDLRDSTRLAAGKLPFDTLYVLNRYISRVTAAIEAQGGYVTSVAGDGVMAIFGADGEVEAGARRALAAALAIWDALADLDAELAEDLRQPLRFGVGLHTGLAVIGAIALSGRSSLQFLGDTGNVAARLEGLTKDLGCVVLASLPTLAAARLTPATGTSRHVLTIRGRDETLAAAAFAVRDTLAATIRPGVPA